jgi:CheY-like chemotaxis protein
MDNKRARLTIVIVENRQMIATILSDLLAGAGYQTRIVFQPASAEDLEKALQSQGLGGSAGPVEKSEPCTIGSS